MSIRLDHMLFPNGKEKAVTFSFDDAVIEDKKLVPLFEKYGLKATFNINAGCFGEKDRMPIPGRELYHEVLPESEIAALYRNHEVAAHGYRHWSMTDCPPDAALADVMLCRAALEKLMDRQVRGYAYPYGHHNSASPGLLEKAGIKYSRTVEDSFLFELPQNPLVWHPTCHFLDAKRDELLKQFLALEVTPYSTGPKLFYLWGHSYELTITNEWENWEAFLQKIAGHDNVWYANNGEIIDYLEAVRRLEYAADRTSIYNPSAQTVWMRLDNTVTALPGGQVWRHAVDTHL